MSLASKDIPTLCCVFRTSPSDSLHCSRYPQVPPFSSLLRTVEAASRFRINVIQLSVTLETASWLAGNNQLDDGDRNSNADGNNTEGVKPFFFFFQCLPPFFLSLILWSERRLCEAGERLSNPLEMFISSQEKTACILTPFISIEPMDNTLFSVKTYEERQFPRLTCLGSQLLHD